MKIKILPFFIISFITILIYASEPSGKIKGIVKDIENDEPLIGVNVLIVGTSKGTITDTSGKFSINNIPVGSYTLEFRYIGYKTLRITDIIVKPARTTYITVKMQTNPLQLEEVKVTPQYFQKNDEQPTSNITFSFEEVRRAPGAAGDISRIVMSLPSVAKINDQSNGLIVRGGNPIENGFYIDDIEVPNINHFPMQGVTNGAISIINVDFIQNVEFYSGGFSSLYGNKLSSIMNIQFREGSREKITGQLDLNFSGLGGIIEGPLFNKKGAFLFSAKRSYLDFLIKTIDMGTSVSPQYEDYQGKLTIDLNPQNKLTILGIFAKDYNNPDRKAALENDMIYYGKQKISQGAIGTNLKTLWNKKIYSKFIFSTNLQKFKETARETNTDQLIRTNTSSENHYNFKNINHIKFNNKNSIDLGIEYKYTQNNYKMHYGSFTNYLGDTTKAYDFIKTINSTQTSLFFNYISKYIKRLTATIGFRADYYGINEKIKIDHRLSFTYQINNTISINASYGIYHQNLPLIFTTDKNLQIPKAIHYIIGFEKLLTENTKLTLEFYRKNYKHFPMSSDQPDLFLIDEIFYGYGFFFNHENLNSSGKAYAQGTELTIQKKIVKNFYGLIGASYFRAKYKNLNDKWINRTFDNKVIFSIQGGYKPNNKWEFSARWIYAGGAPYTPLNIEASRKFKHYIIDETRVNQARYPVYHSLNIRFDRRFYFKKSNLIFYLSIWNAYNHKNIAAYFWNIKKNKKDEIYQWPLLPIIGLEYEF